MKEISIKPEVLKIIKDSKAQGNKIFLPDEELERELYAEVDKALKGMGGKWNRKEKCHIFDYDMEEEFKKVTDRGKYINWKKETQFFPTPKEIAEYMTGLVVITNNRRYKIMEPEAGQGNILDCIPNKDVNEIIAVEINPNHCQYLKNKGYNPICCDFLETDFKDIDFVFMNPPFTKGQEVDHIIHAYSSLKEGGQLVSIISGAYKYNSRGKYKKFKEFLDKTEASILELPPNSFKESGTNIETNILFIEKQ